MLKYLYYIIPKINRELKPLSLERSTPYNYIIPKINRELKQSFTIVAVPGNYIIPKINRELKLQMSVLIVIPELYHTKNKQRTKTQY